MSDSGSDIYRPSTLRRLHSRITGKPAMSRRVRRQRSASVSESVPSSSRDTDDARHLRHAAPGRSSGVRPLDRPASPSRQAYASDMVKYLEKKDQDHIDKRVKKKGASIDDSQKYAEQVRWTDCVQPRLRHYLRHSTMHVDGSPPNKNDIDIAQARLADVEHEVESQRHLLDEIALPAPARVILKTLNHLIVRADNDVQQLAFGAELNNLRLVNNVLVEEQHLDFCLLWESLFIKSAKKHSGAASVDFESLSDEAHKAAEDLMKEEGQHDFYASQLPLHSEIDRLHLRSWLPEDEGPSNATYWLFVFGQHLIQRRLTLTTGATKLYDTQMSHWTFLCIVQDKLKDAFSAIPPQNFAEAEKLFSRVWARVQAWAPYRQETYFKDHLSHTYVLDQSASPAGIPARPAIPPRLTRHTPVARSQRP